MGAQDSWNWKVPTAKGTRWEPYAWKIGQMHDIRPAVVGHTIRRTPLFDWRETLWLNIFCEGRTEEDPHPLFLVGSLQVPAVVLFNSNNMYWEYEETYLTGDGYEIYVNFREDMDAFGNAWSPRSAVFIGDEEEYNDEAINRLSMGTGPDSPIKVVRDLHCLKCGLRATVSSKNLDKVSEFATPLYEAGIREVSLKSFIRFAIQ